MNEISLNEQRRLEAMNLAIKTNAGSEYNENNMPIIDTGKLISAAKSIEGYLRGDHEANKTPEKLK